VQALIGVLGLLVVAGVAGWLNQDYLQERINWYMKVEPYMRNRVQRHALTADDERTLKPRSSFRECDTGCPDMIVIPEGKFMMGSAENEEGYLDEEGPRHEVKIDRFAVSEVEITFEQWDECVKFGNCPVVVSDSVVERGTRPVVKVSWDEAKKYVEWFSRMTGKQYRLLSEAEWEYAARAGSDAPYSWGAEIGKGKANCRDCGSQWSDQSAPVRSFEANAFGLYDMHGNVWEWCADPWHSNYVGAPDRGIVWEGGDTNLRITRGGSFDDDPRLVRAATRSRAPHDFRSNTIGLRVARTL
jgi:formylglycine-generating enzyme required for sulfatase activity